MLGSEGRGYCLAAVMLAHETHLIMVFSIINSRELVMSLELFTSCNK